MKLWIVILILGAAGCGFLFLKAREFDAKSIRKRINKGDKSLKARAKRASGDIGELPIKPPEVLKAEQPVGMSLDPSSGIAKDLAEIMDKEGI